MVCFGNVYVFVVWFVGVYFVVVVEYYVVCVWFYVYFV